jgi:Family of unknown function (DUF6152)
MKSKRLGLLSLFLVFAAGTARAHHSGATYDSTKIVTVKGTVKEFDWRNPHVTILLTTEAHGTEPPQYWRFEMSSPGNLTRAGWTKRSMAPGDIVTVACNPMRDGSHSGLAKKVTLPDGKVLTFDFGNLEKSNLP